MAVAIFPGVVVSLGVPEWGQGTAAIGTAAIGMAAIGAAATGTVITVTIMLSSSAASAFPAGGAGVGAGILTGAIRITDTDMAIRTVTTGMDMDIPATDTAIMGTETVMDMATGTVANTALLPDRKYPSYSADSPAPAIIADQSMESWGPKRGAQSGPTSRTTVTRMRADPVLSTELARVSC